MRAQDLDYALPEELIAQQPPAERDAGRLLVVDPSRGEIRHHRVRDLPLLLTPSLFVVNDTRVIAARLRGLCEDGGAVELLLVERLGTEDASERWLALGRPAKRLRPGCSFDMGSGRLEITVEGRRPSGELELRIRADEPVEDVIASVGEVPLPPYIRRAPVEGDRTRYQTVYAQEPGAVAAPTAGLHLSESLLDELTRAGHRIARITLHVGPGTFAPIRVEDLADHRMHDERFRVPEATVDAVAQARREHCRVVAVGTTVVRTLESTAEGAGHVRAGEGRTSLFIQPPHRFAVVDSLLTNFHLPRSSLLALVMAFGGVDLVRAAYVAAVEHRYRFFSYGDAMLLTGRAP